MRFTSILAIYFLFFCASAFVLLPFGVRKTEEVGGDRIPGQADSAPHRFSVGRHLVKAAILGAVLFGLYYANWINSWLTPDDLDLYSRING